MKTNPQLKAEVGIQPLSVAKKYHTIKLGIDWHVRQYRVVRIIDGAGPEPAQRFTPAKFLDWVGKQLLLADQVYSVYEAGPGGFVLHRQLTALGVHSYVTTPRKLGPHNRKNDQLDARQLGVDLDCFVRGNTKAINPVFIPTREQEQRRQQTRQRHQLQCRRLSVAIQGRSLLLAQGWHESNQWWKAQAWERLAPQLPVWMLESLLIYRELILALEQNALSLKRRIQQAAPTVRPKGLGALCLEEIEREVCDWNRFKNRKSPGCFTGLVGGFASSGTREQDLPITKAGHSRLRAIAVEAAWRWVYYQSQCPLIQRWKGVLLNPHAHKRARKRAIVAVARQLFVDLWRWRTGRATPEELGWVMLDS